MEDGALFEQRFDWLLAQAQAATFEAKSFRNCLTLIKALRSPEIAALGRLPLRLAGHDPEPDTLVTASLSATPRDQPVARSG